ncbi:hypothetical protein protein [Bacillus cereus G9241]|nr:hypothetical protein protein [Bacillus cereus G9241]
MDCWNGQFFLSITLKQVVAVNIDANIQLLLAAFLLYAIE